MATMRITGGVLQGEVVSGGPVDPGYGVPGGGGPVDPGYGVEAPVDPGYGLPLPPVVSHPIAPTPGHPIELPPTYPVDPGYGLPSAPSVWPRPPHPTHPIAPGGGGPAVSPPIYIPVSPEHPIYYPPPGANNELPLPPGAVWPPLPPDVTGKVMCLIWIVGAGYRWTVIDTSLKPSHPLPPTTVPEPGVPTHPIQPTPEPRRG